MIPCKRPKVTVEPRTDADTFIVLCRVPRCGFQYPSDLKFHALKSDADGMAAMHRRAHRQAVPQCDIGPGLGGVHIVACDCGHETSRTTKADAVAHRDHHLSTAHGLVTCS